MFNFIHNKILFFIKYIILFYKREISPYKKGSCKFYPSCSDYSLEAFNKYGLFKGFFLSLKRFLKCNPFSKGGLDPLL